MSARLAEAQLPGFAERIAREAGSLLLRHFRAITAQDLEFKGRRELVTFADREAELALVAAIRKERPGDAILAEEGAASPKGQADQESEWLWIIDPIDGTTNFVHGHPFFSVSLGLWHRGQPWLGVVHAPSLDETYAACLGQGARMDGRPIRVSATATLKDALLATGFSYQRNEPGAETNLAAFGKALMECRDLRRCGSAALDLAYVAAGRYDAYWESELMPYDVAAGAVLVREAGGKVTDYSGGDRWLHGKRVVASNGALHPAMLGMLA